MSDCIFCRIIRKEIPSKIIYEDDLLIAFHDIAPQAPVHLLIVPKEHIPDNLALTSAHEALIGHIFSVANELAQDLGIAGTGFRIVNNCGKNGGQAVAHIHFHLLGGRTMHWPPG